MSGGKRGHVPVLLGSFLAAAAPRTGQRWVDGTFGRGGYSEALLQRGAKVLALDCDAASGAAADELRAAHGTDFEWLNENFADMKKACAKKGWKDADGIVLDLGVSSPQLDEAGRGFSFRQSGPLDMRMDRRGGITAADIVNNWSEEELSRTFYEEGDERDSRRIARAVTSRRAERPFEDTVDLADVVARSIPRRGPQRVHPATKVFQALRIAVNRERAALAAVLPDATGLLVPGGVLAVVSFHSGEDRVVKNFLRDKTAENLDLPAAPISIPNPDRRFSQVKRYLPTDEEIELNPRCRSARLRVAWKLEAAS